MGKERKKGFAWSAVLHAIIFILLIAGLPNLFEPPHDTEPSAITVELLPVKELTNVKPSESTPAPKKEPEKKPEAKKPSPPVKTAENAPPPPKEEKEKKEKKPEKKKAEEKKPEKKPDKKMKEEDLLAVLKAVKETAEKENKKNTKTAEDTSATKSRSQQYSPDLPLSISEKDAIKSQIARCWAVPAGAKDAHDLVIVLRARYEKDGSLINVELADKSKSRYASDTFFRAAADSAMRAVRMCTPLKSLPPDKFETWRDMELTFDPKEMLF